MVKWSFLHNLLQVLSQLRAVIHLSLYTFDAKLEFENVNEEPNIDYRRKPLLKSSDSPYFKYS